ncbi:MAG TPA: LptA/OstA family protein [Steroidobacteraceae bacterium]|jgi:lipopolysaccharide transport protein LptA
MAASTRDSNRRVRAIGVLLFLSAPLALAAAAAPNEPPFDWAADVLNSNFRTDVHELSGNVRVAQGPMSIESEQATAVALQTDHSKWTFERSVHIKTAEADLKSSAASAAFVNGEISEARATGSPAYFEQRGGPVDKQVKGRAGIIEYDFDKGIVRLSDDVWFSYGGNEFRTNKVIYNLREERVVANPDGQNAGRVNITVRPKNGEIKLNSSKPAKPGATSGKDPASRKDTDTGSNPDTSPDTSQDAKPTAPDTGKNGTGT